MPCCVDAKTKTPLSNPCTKTHLFLILILILLLLLLLFPPLFPPLFLRCMRPVPCLRRPAFARGLVPRRTSRPLKKSGTIACEACLDDTPASGKSLGEGGKLCHQPFSAMSFGNRTRL